MFQGNCGESSEKMGLFFTFYVQFYFDIMLLGKLRDFAQVLKSTFTFILPNFNIIIFGSFILSVNVNYLFWLFFNSFVYHEFHFVEVSGFFWKVFWKAMRKKEKK